MSNQPPHAAASPLKLEVEEHEGETVVKCVGRLVAGTTDPLRAEVKELIPRSKRIVLDFGAVTFMDSSGLGAVVRLYVSAKAGRSELQFVNLAPRVRQLFGMTHLLSLFEPCGQHNIRIP